MRYGCQVSNKITNVFRNLKNAIINNIISFKTYFSFWHDNSSRAITGKIGKTNWSSKIIAQF